VRVHEYLAPQLRQRVAAAGKQLLGEAGHRVDVEQRPVGVEDDGFDRRSGGGLVHGGSLQAKHSGWIDAEKEPNCAISLDFLSKIGHQRYRSGHSVPIRAAKMSDQA